MAGITSARGQVDKHVEPKECFVWYESNDNWKPIHGTGCAHWVAHQLNIQQGALLDRCLAGFTYRVKRLIEGRKLIFSPKDKKGKIGDVQLNDIYVTPAVDHMGLVFKIEPSADKGDPKIFIRHDSSGQGKVAENEFAKYFHGKGLFYRL
jgi:hypothetical protein